MPNIMNMQALGGISQNVPISLPFAVTGGGNAVITNPGALRSQVRQAFGPDLPPLLDVTSILSPALPAAIAPASSFQMPVMASCGAPHTACAITLSQGGSVVLNRYLDPLGAILATTATAMATANVACVLDASASSLFQSWNLVLSNTAASGATLSSFSAVLGSH